MNGERRHLMSVCLLVIKGIPTSCVSPFLIDLYLNVDYVRKLFLDISMFYLSNVIRIVQAENSNTLHSTRPKVKIIMTKVLNLKVIGLIWNELISMRSDYFSSRLSCYMNALKNVFKFIFRNKVLSFLFWPQILDIFWYSRVILKIYSFSLSKQGLETHILNFDARSVIRRRS